ncbi:MAG: TIR domain-containing protein [bacterium]
MSGPTVFLSYSSRDKGLVRQLAARLRGQDLTIWIYEDEGQEIPVGSVVLEELKRRIDRADYFIPIASPAAFESRFATAEVEHALARSASGSVTILPIAISEAVADDPHAWPSPFRDLADHTVHRTGFHSQAAVEETVRVLCEQMSVPFAALRVAHPRFRILDRFREEVTDKVPRRNEYEIGVYSRLIRLADEIQEAYEEGDHELALARAQLFAGLCRYEFPDERFFYPEVVVATCLAHLGHADSAEEIFVSLLDHPLADETLYGGLGHLRLQAGDFETAHRYYRIADELHPDDPAALSGLALGGVENGVAVDLDGHFERIESLGVETEEDRIRVAGLRAYLLARTGRTGEAIAAFRDLTGAGQADEVVYNNLALVLAERGDLDGACSILEEGVTHFPTPELRHLLATFTARAHRLESAATLFRDLVRDEPRHRRYRVDAATVLWRLGDRDGAREITGPLVEQSDIPPPRDSDDFWFDGFANWFWGRRERADYDFQRSGRGAADHYDCLMG